MRQSILSILFLVGTVMSPAQTYNTLWIPDTLSGPSFNLTLKDTMKQIRSGNQTITSSINTDNFWGPTLIMNKWQNVSFNVKNKLNDSTTLHWHGMHLPAVMDGGPHQVIPPGTTWQPYWQVTNQASTLWYHPHLHMMTNEQMSKGLGGLIIIRDSAERALALPRRYGIDDIPLVLTSRRYDASNQFVYTNVAYGDYMLTNGTPSAQVSLPKQFVRLRLLNAESERAYNIGFSDNRNFYVIGNDGGLLNAPVTVNRLKLLVGERVEVLVDLGSDAVGSTVDLNAYNAGFPLGFPGGEPAQSGQFGSLLNNTTFCLLHVVVAPTTTNAVTALPATLLNNVYWTASNATVSRTLNITNGQPGNPIPFNFDNASFVMSTINKTVTLNTIEKWTVKNNNVFGHAFHIHDVEFKIVDRNGSAAGVNAYESGWKDVMYVPINESVTFVAKFNDYADPIHPFMYHCHFGLHEDDGMMGQFVVTDPSTGLATLPSEKVEFLIYPNPATQRVYVKINTAGAEAYYISVLNTLGKTVLMLPQPDLEKGIDVSALAKGVYYIQLTDKKTKSVSVQQFIKE